MSSACPLCGRTSARAADDPGPCVRCAGAIDVTRALEVLENPTPREGPPWAGQAGKFHAVAPLPTAEGKDPAPPESGRKPRPPWRRRAVLVAGALLLVAIGVALGALLQFFLSR